MRCECPNLRRCCLCIPLRFGLMGAGCAKLSMDLLFLTLMIAEFPHLYRPTTSVLWLINYTVIILLFVTDLIFNIVLLYGCIKKNTVMLRVFYRYSIFLLVINILFFLFIACKAIRNLCYNMGYWHLGVYYSLMYLSSWMTIVLLNVYLVILVRSEVGKIENNAQFQFTNNADGACYMTTVVEQSGPTNEAETHDEV